MGTLDVEVAVIAKPMALSIVIAVELSVEEVLTVSTYNASLSLISFIYFSIILLKN